MCKAGCRLINSSYLFFTLLAIWVRFSKTYCDPQGPLRRLNSAQWHWRQAWKKMLVDWQSLLEEIGTVVEGLLEDRERQWHVHSRSPKILSCNCWRQKGAPHTHTYTHQHAQNGSSCKVLVTVPALVAARHVQLGELNEMLSYSFYVHYSGSQSVQSPKQTVGQNLPVSTRC